MDEFIHWHQPYLLLSTSSCRGSAYTVRAPCVLESLLDVMWLRFAPSRSARTSNLLIYTLFLFCTPGGCFQMCRMEKLYRLLRMLHSLCFVQVSISPFISGRDLLQKPWLHWRSQEILQVCNCLPCATVAIWNESSGRQIPFQFQNLLWILHTNCTCIRLVQILHPQFHTSISPNFPFFLRKIT